MVKKTIRFAPFWPGALALLATAIFAALLVRSPMAQAEPLAAANLQGGYPSPNGGTLSNISTRGRVGTGDNVMIGGFFISGAPVKVIVRAIGPSMANPPLNVPGTLQDPVLQLYSGQTVIAENDNWQTGNCTTEAENRKPQDFREACLAITLDPGPYTAIVRGAGGTTGIGLVEVFNTSGAQELINISTRGNVLTGDNVLIGGTIIANGPAKVIVRAIGPSMGNPPFNVPGTIQDPLLKLYSGQTVIAENDNWQTGNCPTEAAENRRPQDAREACLAITLDSGPYTAIVSGVGGTTGVGLVEVFIVR